MQTHKKLRVTFQSKPRRGIDKVYTNVEIFDMTPDANGFVPDYKLRAMALGWVVVKVEEV